MQRWRRQRLRRRPRLKVVRQAGRDGASWPSIAYRCFGAEPRCGQCFSFARDIIAARGFGDAFGHSLGHGLGLEVHEAPRLAATSESPLPPHAVVTVEPGVYFPGWGGVRLEDDVYLAPEGPRRLSDGRTELLELG